MKPLHKQTKQSQVKRIPLVLGGAACLIILLICILIINGWFKKPNNNDNSNIINGIDYTGIAGLKVENFKLSELHNPYGSSGAPFIYAEMSDLFLYGNDSPQMFAFVRVTGTEQWKRLDEQLFSAEELAMAERGELAIVDTYTQLQTSQVDILAVIWSRNCDETKTITVTQAQYGGCCINEESNLLREGGVYFLPLWYREKSDTWYITGGTEVLFEIDDKGCIWSHSSQKSFYEYDGKHASTVANAINILTLDKNMLAANTEFGYTASGGSTSLMEVTVLSVENTAPDINEWGFGNYSCILEVNSILSISDYTQDRWKLMKGDTIDAFSYSHPEDIKQLESGKRYLMILDFQPSRIHLILWRVARINDDNTITAISSSYEGKENILKSYNGCTVNQMKEEAERARSWLIEHPGTNISYYS